MPGPWTTSSYQGRSQGQSSSCDPLGFSLLMSDVLFTLNHSSDARKQKGKMFSPQHERCWEGRAAVIAGCHGKLMGETKGKISSNKNSSKTSSLPASLGQGLQDTPSSTKPEDWGGGVGEQTSQSHCNQVQAGAPRQTEASR